MPQPVAQLVWQASTAVAAATPLPTWAVAGTIWGLVAVIVLALAAGAALESLTYFVRQPPITWYVRSEVSAHAALGITAGLAVLVLVAVGFTHFVIDR